MSCRYVGGPLPLHLDTSLEPVEGEGAATTMASLSCICELVEVSVEEEFLLANKVSSKVEYELIGGVKKVEFTRKTLKNISATLRT